MQDTSTIDIDLSAIDHNMAVLRSAVGGGCGLCPIVKADAYGLGVGRVARRLVSAGAEMLAVYSLRQAIETAAAVNAAVPVLVLMPVFDIAREDELVRLVLAGQLHLVVHDELQAARLAECAESLGATLPVHLELDVGMSRGGAAPEEAARILRAIATGGRLSLRGIFTHFSHSRSSSEITERELAAFDAFLAAHRRLIPAEAIEHVASTYALARGRRYHRGMVRFGLAWLGYGLEELCADSPLLASGDLRPAVRWSSRLVQVKRVAEGASVGYGARWTAPRASTIGLVPVGYADGYPTSRAAGDGGAAFVRVLRPDGTPAEAPVVGAVNMDQITVDLTGLGASRMEDWLGCEVELISRDRRSRAHLPAVAAASGMIVHECLTRLNPRIPRSVSSAVSVSLVSGPESTVAARAGASDGPRLGSAAG